MITMYVLYGFTENPNSVKLKHRGGGMQCDSLPGDGFPMVDCGQAIDSLVTCLAFKHIKLLKSFTIPGFSCPLFASANVRTCTRTLIDGTTITEEQVFIDSIYISMHAPDSCKTLTNYLDTLYKRRGRGVVEISPGVIVGNTQLATDTLGSFYKMLRDSAFINFARGRMRDRYFDSTSKTQIPAKCDTNDPNCDKCANYYRNIQGYCMAGDTIKKPILIPTVWGDSIKFVVPGTVYPIITSKYTLTVDTSTKYVSVIPVIFMDTIKVVYPIISYRTCTPTCCPSLYKMCFIDAERDTVTGVQGHLRVTKVNLPKPSRPIGNQACSYMRDPNNPWEVSYPPLKDCYEFCTTDTTLPQINIKGLPTLPKQQRVK
jgi:hypothetical protein